MKKCTSLLQERLQSKKQEKMSALAEKTSSGNLSSFAGVFGVACLNAAEKESLRALLEEFRHELRPLEEDLQALMQVTSELKAITNQAIVLHGERIAKAQKVLLPYRDGAFSAWLVATYGNRQTPYNFLQYYLFHRSLSPRFRDKLETMPRQIVYALASRTQKTALPAEVVERCKEEILEKYTGQPKEEIMEMIRQAFPLKADDGRARNGARFVVSQLEKTFLLMKNLSFQPTERQKEQILIWLEEIKKNLGERI